MLLFVVEPRVERVLVFYFGFNRVFPILEKVTFSSDFSKKLEKVKTLVQRPFAIVKTGFG